MSSPETPSREETPRGLPPPREHSSPVSPAVAKTLVVVAAVWILATAAVAFVAGAGSTAVPQGWRLSLLQMGSVVGFIALIAAGVAAIIVIERRGPP